MQEWSKHSVCSSLPTLWVIKQDLLVLLLGRKKDGLALTATQSTHTEKGVCMFSLGGDHSYYTLLTCSYSHYMIIITRYRSESKLCSYSGLALFHLWKLICWLYNYIKPKCFLIEQSRCSLKSDYMWILNMLALYTVWLDSIVLNKLLQVNDNCKIRFACMSFQPENIYAEQSTPQITYHII